MSTDIDKKLNDTVRAAFAVEEQKRLDNEAAGRVHDCKKAGCTVDPQGLPIVKV